MVPFAVKPSISVLHHMARSGGTLMSKCIGCMDQIALLSEVHPHTAAGKLNPLFQASQWLEIDVEKEVRSTLGQVEGVTWLQAIQLVYGCVTRRGQHLVIRDWSHLDFTGAPWGEPTYKFTTLQVLATEFKIHRAFSVRHPIDQWSSLTKLDAIRGSLDVATYMKGYRAFAEEAVDGVFVRYEDFTRQPEEKIRLLCEELEVPYDGDFLSKWSEYTTITGDVSSASPGRATHATEIKPLQRSETDGEMLAQFEKSPDFVPSLQLLGYEP